MLIQAEKIQLMHNENTIVCIAHTRNVIKSKAIFPTELECTEEQSNTNTAHQLGKYETS